MFKKINKAYSGPCKYPIEIDIKTKNNKTF